MTNTEGQVTSGHVEEPTLAAVLTAVVRTTVPTRLYGLLHLAFPLAVDFAYRGWWRPAAAAIAVTAFGAWGLADRWISTTTSGESATRKLVVRVGRSMAGATAATLAALLLLELFLRLLGSAPTL